LRAAQNRDLFTTEAGGKQIKKAFRVSGFEFQVGISREVVPLSAGPLRLSFSTLDKALEAEAIKPET
jgi:hypothetical protein